jgi:DUF971 family protein
VYGDKTLPKEVIFHRASGQLELAWQDASRRVFSGAFLRHHCKCAMCEQQRRKGVAIEQSTSKILRVIDLGNIGLNISFDDEHYRGIFPWAYLRELKDVL